MQIAQQLNHLERQQFFKNMVESRIYDYPGFIENLSMPAEAHFYLMNTSTSNDKVGIPKYWYPQNPIKLHEQPECYVVFLENQGGNATAVTLAWYLPMIENFVQRSIIIKQYIQEFF